MYGEASFWKSQKSYFVDSRQGSKYVFGVGFTVEKVYRAAADLGFNLGGRNESNQRA